MRACCVVGMCVYVRARACVCVCASAHVYVVGMCVCVCACVRMFARERAHVGFMLSVFVPVNRP